MKKNNFIVCIAILFCLASCSQDNNVYSITYELHGGVHDNPSTYSLNDYFKLNDPVREGYTFKRWYTNGYYACPSEYTETGFTNEISSIPVYSREHHTKVGCNLTLEAVWEVNLNKLVVFSSDVSKGNVVITKGEGYTDENITVNAGAFGDSVFKGWFHDGIKVSGKTTYTFVMPPRDYYLLGVFTNDEESATWDCEHGVVPTFSDDKKTITYGLYPQTRVTDPDLLAELCMLENIKNDNWYFYKNDYYTRMTTDLYSYDYNRFNDGQKIYKNTPYWFRCDPIQWNVLSEHDGEYYLLSNQILDNKKYDRGQSELTLDKVGKIIGEMLYRSNYEYSEIRAWLNGNYIKIYDESGEDYGYYTYDYTGKGFINVAFKLNDTYLQTTLVNNSASTTGPDAYPYVCNNTEDKVFLPSYQDYINENYGFPSSTESWGSFGLRRCKVTDYALAMGARYGISYLDSDYYAVNHWTRSPYDGENLYICGLDGDLKICSSSNYCGVRPAIIIKM